MSWLITGKEAGSLGLLDQYGGAAAAYSLRRLSVYNTGPVVRVRRSSDNTEQDFTAAQITDGTLTTFCGAGDGFVRTWYDQSGSGLHLGQATTTLQPQIVSSGTLITKGTRTTIDFDGVNDRLINSAISLSQPVTHIIVGSRDDASGPADAFFDSLNNTQHIFYNRGTTEAPSQSQYWAIDAGNPIPPSTSYSVSTDLFLASALFSGAFSSLRMNGAAHFTGNTFTNGLSGLSIGDLRGNPTPISASYALDGKISEYIIYGSNQFSVIAAIEANINAHYSIY